MRSRHAAEGMSGRVADGIRLGLDDATGDAPGARVVHDDLAEQEARERDGVGGELGAAESAEAHGDAWEIAARGRLQRP